jgi:glycosyltransferase involved in cell wall biosynthesis
MKPTSVTIGIPAYNEEHTIVRLVVSLLAQRTKSFRLSGIVVVSDGSTDGTVSRIRQLHNKRVRIIANTTRKGKPARLNQIFGIADSDLLVILDADLMLKGTDVLERLVRPMVRNTGVHYVSGWATPLPPKNMTQKIAYANVMIWRNAVSREINNDLYYSSGAIGVLRKRFYKNLRLPDSSADDSALYLACISQGFQFRKHVDTGVCYSLPTEWNDYVHQWVRFLHSQTAASESFGQKEAGKYYTISSAAKLRAAIEYFLHEPFWSMCYAASRMYIGSVSLFDRKQKSSLWSMATSTKTA